MNTAPEPVEISLDTSAEVRDVALQIAQTCRRELYIASRHLDPAIYDSNPFIEALKALAINNRLARIRILVNDSAPVVSNGHRLIELAYRLSSFIAIRTPSRDYRQFNEAMLLADNTAYIHRRFADRYEGTASFDDKRVASDLTRRFNEIWERAEIDPNFRRLHL